MSKLKLTLACWDYDRTRPLIDGRVQAEGIDLEIKVLRPRETFPRMLEHKEFEVSELSLGSYVSLIGPRRLPLCCGAGRAVQDLSTLVYLHTDRCGDPDASGPPRQTSGNDAARFYRHHLHEWDAATRIRCDDGGYSLVHRRNDNADPATVDSVEAAGQDQGRVSAGGPDTGGNAGERRS